MEFNYKVVYYLLPSGENPVKTFLDSLQEIQKAKVFRIFNIYQQYGLLQIIPHTRKLIGTPLWEIRIKGKDNIRIIYITHTEKSILILHGFIKKTQKTPIKELNIALSRLQTFKQLLDK
ncbi:hypothetical protein A3J20_01085 [Candidatus Gottesmanbacteria bacterium RIFCSPLOWO2_02_FULL_42_29]|uniref:Addiction module toxin RelE n=2 Tax=Candidatus Gottesmaniibacteriota TaxID=1752720 RepID=A0A1F6BHF9_9BACT|nr:MAG: Toxin-antitoxin system, toxin component, RelE family [Candidatus Gottesmanbacteria bacterium GW2011_GWA2_42_18]KKS75205.1 MAG: Toxin-antitoxin system, toxin component, RelE family [Candidatus Gottesmanbacteria bacterium GW2011_GWC2_42_8]OGG10921.1 MAG: hypothetical protein A2781_07020 [Candidatus Gottesmanbacteria bacterium RIFCSPHIGHO2_01_FULL_42_27]OGG22944.1 MAG: hypothetical protein A3E72_00190 [Candidatus Gottesmanbacteria bacterium RIFCSPHIGHO2_12_FULL_43_26]OGG35585.1 MAG: hypoth